MIIAANSVSNDLSKAQQYIKICIYIKVKNMINSRQENEATNLSESLFKLIKEVMPEDEQISLLEALEARKNTRRDSPRKKYSMDINYSTEGSEYQGYLRNLSVSGVFIEIDEFDDSIEDLTQGQKIFMTIPDTGHNKYVKAKGTIVRISSDGVGVKFG